MSGTVAKVILNDSLMPFLVLTPLDSVVLPMESQFHLLIRFILYTGCLFSNTGRFTGCIRTPILKNEVLNRGRYSDLLALYRIDL